MKTFIIATIILTATTAFAIDQPPQGQGQNFDQVKSNVINRINARIAHNQEELSCVQAAKNHADLKACRDKFREEQKELRGQNQGQRKGPGQQQ